MTPEKVWVREGILPDFPNNRPPQFDLAEGKDLRVPKPRISQAEMQEQGIRDLEVDPKLYYPEEYYPVLITEWPVDRDLLVPSIKLPPKLKQRMGEAERVRDALRAAHGLEP